jgi:hypothetical protein
MLLATLRNNAIKTGPLRMLSLWRGVSSEDLGSRHNRLHPLVELGVGLSVACVSPVASQSPSRLTGDYVCTFGCRLTDANRCIIVNGGEAECVRLDRLGA